ncbi:histone-like nucleoid-structuring protein Lsr2 [Streptomyces sp. NPDC006638]|uniref:Lsr2 family DNA-binding protein n=1 Tax=Streptomyces sp. NPDC006638 TaxID=3157183 RepID=UPI00339F27A3
MFNDWQRALEAESLSLNPTGDEQRAAAARVAARSSRDKDDMTLLLDVLGLPADPDTVTTLLPLLPQTGDATTMTTTTPAAPALSAHEAVAISMHTNGDTRQAIREATGLSETELSDLIAHHAVLGPTTPTEAPPAADALVIDVPVVPISASLSDEVHELLAWAAAHPAASVRGRAARISADLAELTERRGTEAVQREAEERVARAKADLERAQEELRALKVGSTRTTTTVTAPTPSAVRTGRSSGRTREELAAIRTWARANGHQVADLGMVPKRVMEGYDAAHRAPVRKAG